MAKRRGQHSFMKFEKELKDAGIENPLIGPMVLPDYTTEVVKGKQWTAHYEGTLR